MDATRARRLIEPEPTLPNQIGMHRVAFSVNDIDAASPAGLSSASTVMLRSLIANRRQIGVPRRHTP